MQEKSVDSIPDATITQESFKIVVETKMSDWFYEDQLLRHLNAFGDEKYKVMITLAPELMEENKKAIFEKRLKVIARITAVETENGVKYNAEFGELTDERKEVIAKAMDDGDSHAYDLRTIEHRYFFVEKFYETDFKKVSPRAPMGTRIFDLTQIFGTDELPSIEQLAEILKNETWT